MAKVVVVREVPANEALCLLGQPRKPPSSEQIALSALKHRRDG